MHFLGMSDISSHTSRGATIAHAPFLVATTGGVVPKLEAGDSSGRRTSRT